MKVTRAALPLLMLGLGLSGCIHYTTKGLREEAPVLSASSAKSTNDIVGCINTAWEKIGNVNFVPNGHGGSVSLSPPAILGAPVVYLIDIDDQGPARQIVFRMGKTMWTKQVSHARETVQACL